MGNVDSIPVVSQVKSLGQVIAGDTDGARRTQEQFANTCPVVSQIASGVEAISGDTDAARRRQETFLSKLPETLVFNYIPPVIAIGHVFDVIVPAPNVPAKTLSVQFELFYELGDHVDSTFDFSHLKNIAKELKIISTNALRQFGERKRAGHLNSWEDVIAALNQTDVLEQFQQPVVKTDVKHFASASDFKWDGGPERHKIEEFKNWFRNLINDEDVLNSTRINKDLLEKLGNRVTQTGVTVDSFDTFWNGTESVNADFLDIGILRFPDFDHPYLKMYRIHLHVWRSSNRVLWHQKDSFGYGGTYNCSKYQPRSSRIAQLTEEARNAEVAEYNSWIDENEAVVKGGTR